MKFCNKEQQGKQLAQTKHYEQGTNVSRSNIGNQNQTIYCESQYHHIYSTINVD